MTFGPDGFLSTRQLMEVVDDVAVTPSLWRSYPVHNPERRGQVQLVVNRQFEVWLLGWCPGQHVELHDHGESSAAFRVVLGRLTEVRLRGDGLARAALVPGVTHHAPTGTIHDVINPGPGLATSIHAYSPPLTAMNFYWRDALARRGGSERALSAG